MTQRDDVITSRQDLVSAICLDMTSTGRQAALEHGLACRLRRHDAFKHRLPPSIENVPQFIINFFATA